MRKVLTVTLCGGNESSAIDRSHLPLSRLVQSSTACCASLVVVPISKMPPATVINSVSGMDGPWAEVARAASKTVGVGSSAPRLFVGGMVGGTGELIGVPTKVPEGLGTTTSGPSADSVLGPASVCVAATVVRGGCCVISTLVGVAGAGVVVTITMVGPAAS